MMVTVPADLLADFFDARAPGARCVILLVAGEVGDLLARREFRRRGRPAPIGLRTGIFLDLGLDLVHERVGHGRQRHDSRAGGHNAAENIQS